jgi:hypothetical protein
MQIAIVRKLNRNDRETIHRAVDSLCHTPFSPD